MVEIGHRFRPVDICFFFFLLSIWFGLIPPILAADTAPQPSVTVKPTTAQPIEITAERIEYLQNVDIYEADGSVVVVQGPVRLTADHITLMMLSGTMIATGHVHLTDPTSDIRSERMELDVNTEAGVVTNGELYLRETTTLVTGRLLQRFSEHHYRVKEGSFTNCEVKPGEAPAWRFTFEDLDLNLGESIYAKSAWFCVNDLKLIPFPSVTYPIQTARKTGLLFPTIGWDNRFGFHYRQGFFWAINPSQDLTITPDILTNRGYGGDLGYRYVLSRSSRGEWLLSYLNDTEINKSRGQVIGYHIQQVRPDLTIRSQAFLMTDPNYLSDLSNSGIQRALPSSDSYLNINQRFTHGNLYLLGQYLQPLTAGGKDTFQRLPEVGYRFANVAPFGGPLLLGMDGTFVNFYREEGFSLNRVDMVPSLQTDVLSVGHMVGVTPQIKLRETYYTRNIAGGGAAHRETFWVGVDAASRLSRRFRQEDGGSVLHTIEPRIVYEYVPPTRQSDIPKIDDVDDLPEKNLITYSLRSRLLGQKPQAGTSNWLNLLIAQSYHLGSTQSRARNFIEPIEPLFGSITQPLEPVTVPVQGKKFSDLWTRAEIGNPVGVFRGVGHVLTIDTFFDPYQGSFSQWNTDLRFQREKQWYVEVGQRFAREGNRVRRGDIWNPISFNEVFAPTPELNFLTLAGAIRGPFGWTFGARSFYDIKNRSSPETDVVALYQNPCQCWSLGLYYIQFPDRVQYNFMISLAGIGVNQNFGTQLMRYLLEPLLAGERALPWPAPYGKRVGPVGATASGRAP